MTLNNLNYYNISKEEASKAHTGRIVQTINISGEVNITKKWKIGFTNGYDITNKDMSYTSVDIYRDLHCWEMRFSWVPFGYYRSWFFQINIKADALQDLKYEKRHSYQENTRYYLN